MLHSKDYISRILKCPLNQHRRFSVIVYLGFFLYRYTFDVLLFNFDFDLSAHLLEICHNKDIFSRHFCILRIKRLVFKQYLKKKFAIVRTNKIFSSKIYLSKT